MDRVWVTIYDAHAQAWTWWLGPLLPITFTSLILYNLMKLRQNNPEDKKYFTSIITPSAIVMIGILLTTLMLHMAWQNAVIKIRALDSGKFQQAEGPIIAFSQESRKRGALDIFSIHAQRFTYYDPAAANDLHGHVTYSGCLSEGIPARVAYIDNLVLSMEVKIAPPRNQEICQAESAPEVYQPN